MDKLDELFEDEELLNKGMHAAAAATAAATAFELFEQFALLAAAVAA